MVLIPEEKKLSLIRRYPLESLVILLIGAITFQSLRVESTERKVDKMQGEMRAYLITDRQASLQIVVENTETMKEVTRAMQNMSNTLAVLISKK